MDIILVPLLVLLMSLINLVVWIIIIQVILSWLRVFNIINFNNRFVFMLVSTLDRVTEPLLRPIRKIIPQFGGVDFAPVLLIFFLYFVQGVLGRIAARLV